jgi:hypothetical protein
MPNNIFNTLNNKNFITNQERINLIKKFHNKEINLLELLKQFKALRK